MRTRSIPVALLLGACCSGAAAHGFEAVARGIALWAVAVGVAAGAACAAAKVRWYVGIFVALAVLITSCTVAALLGPVNADRDLRSLVLFVIALVGAIGTLPLVAAYLASSRVVSIVRSRRSRASNAP